MEYTPSGAISNDLDADPRKLRMKRDYSLAATPHILELPRHYGMDRTCAVMHATDGKNRDPW